MHGRLGEGHSTPRANRTMRTTLSAMMSAEAAAAMIVIHRAFANSPITRRLFVSLTRGIIANGMPRLSTTWLSTSAQVGSTPMARTTSAGLPHDRKVHAQQALHDRRARIGSDSARGQPRGEESDAEEEADDLAEVGRDDRVRTFDGVGAGLAAQCRGSQQEHRDIHGTGDDEGEDDVPAAGAQQLPSRSGRIVTMPVDRQR